jgi:hypothetical protein
MTAIKKHRNYELSRSLGSAHPMTRRGRTKQILQSRQKECYMKALNETLRVRKGFESSLERKMTEKP